MASIAVGMLIGTYRTTLGNVAGNICARLMGDNSAAAGSLSISGVAYESGSPARRLLKLYRNGQNNRAIAETYTDPVTGAYAFRNLPPGNYGVIDECPDNSRVALVYDWVVAS